MGLIAVVYILLLKYSIIYSVKNGFSEMIYEHNMAVNGCREFAVNLAIFTKVCCDFLICHRFSYSPTYKFVQDACFMHTMKELLSFLKACPCIFFVPLTSIGPL